MGKRKHRFRRSKSSPGFINGWRGNDPFDSEIEESPKHGEGFSWPGIPRNENLKTESDPEIINNGISSKNKTESSRSGVCFNGNEEGDGYPIFKPLSDPCISSFSLPSNSFSHSSSSRNSSISLRIPSSNVSSASLSSTQKSSNSYEDMDHKKGILGDNGFELTFPVSDLGESQQGTFLGRMRSLIKSPPLVQAMDRSGEGYDPQRIPSAIFETNRAVEWSVASNESLFSLHLGRTNSSSPEPQLFSWGVDLGKSGELDPLAVHRLSAARTSDSDNWLRTSDVEIHHVLKKIEEYRVQNREITVEENAADERVIVEVNDKYVADETNNKIQLTPTTSELKVQVPSFDSQVLIADIGTAKITKDSEESVKSTNSFAFEVLVLVPN